MELQERHRDFERAGIAVFAVSYDPVPVLASFAERYGITYTLLSDEGSRAIRSLGLLNTRIEEQAAHYGRPFEKHHRGVPYPGTFTLDERGVVVEKRFEQSYRVRPQAAALLEDLGVRPQAAALLEDLPATPDRAGSGVRASARTPELGVTAWIARATYRPYQRLDLHFDLAVGPGLHVYGNPVPDGYTPLEVEIDPLESLEVAAPRWPEPRPFRVAGLDERFVVHEGAMRGTVPLFLTRNLGHVELVARLRYQACSADECYPPGEVVLRLPLEGLENVHDR